MYFKREEGSMSLRHMVVVGLLGLAACEGGSADSAAEAQDGAVGRLDAGPGGEGGAGNEGGAGGVGGEGGQGNEGGAGGIGGEGGVGGQGGAGNEGGAGGQGGADDGFMPRALGRVTPLDTPCPRGLGPVPNTSCQQLEVTCPGTEPIQVELRTTEPSAPLRGLVILQSGSGGSGFFSNAGPAAEGLITDLSNLGFRVVERGWTPGGAGWFGGTSEGPGQAACRFATLVAWTQANLAEGSPVCAAANSGGTFEQILSLTRYDTGDRLALGIMTSGPLARLTDACPTGVDPTWPDRCRARALELFPECGGGDPERVGCTLGDGAGGLVDAAYGADTPCLGSVTPVDAERVAHDNPFSPTTRQRFGLPLIFAYGSEDCAGGTTPNGLAMADDLAAVGNTIEVHALPGVPHQVQGHPDGAAFLRTTIDRLCVPQAPCAADADCPADFTCTAGRCLPAPVAPECAADADCGADQRCDAGTCVAGPCVEDAECPMGAVCGGEGRCVAVEACAEVVPAACEGTARWQINGRNRINRLRRLICDQRSVSVRIYRDPARQDEVARIDDVFCSETDLNALLGPGRFFLAFFDANGAPIQVGAGVGADVVELR